MAYLEDESFEPSQEEEILRPIQFGPTLTKEEREELESLVIEFSELFVTRHADLPSVTLEEHKIELVEGAHPMRTPQRWLAPDKSRVLKEELDMLLEGGFITQVRNTEWVSPMVIVPKKEGCWKVSVDYKALNRVTKRNRQPLPFIDELLDNVAGHKFTHFLTTTVVTIK
jgi:hypothetical protein